MWEGLNREVGGRLIKVQSPLSVCRDAPDGASCGDLLREMKNPYFIGDEVGLTQTAGWVDAWEPQPSVYAVAAETAHDVVAAVDFARDNNLRLVRKGRWPQLSRQVERARLPADLDPADERRHPAGRFRRAGLRGTAAAPTRRHGGARRDMDAYL
jgi:hypothetical protein